MPSQTVSILVPDLATLSDAEVAEFARMMDGRWSDQTKGLMRVFKAERLDLNKWWAATWQGWSCPCCRRSKPELARLSPGGVLLCNLEVHHDHLGDWAGRIFREANPTKGGPEATQMDHAKHAVQMLCERFARTLLCQDCNAAEGAAKTRLNDTVPKDFTFTPREIATRLRGRHSPCRKSL